MKINRNFLMWIVLSVVSVVSFQNCGQQGDISLKLDDTASGSLIKDICAVNPEHVRCTNETPTGKIEEYRYVDVKQPEIPDLKIFLVLDNSDSMRVSQVNLVNNIEKMFNANSAGLKDYNSEIFIITTAQLNNIGNSLFRNNVNAKNNYQKVIERIHEISNVAYVQSIIDVLRPNAVGGRKTTGLLEGDMIGFKAKMSRSPTAADPKYDTLDVNFSPAYLTHVEQSSIFSVKYAKGESIQDLVDKVKARVEFLDPDKQALSQSIAFGVTPVDNVPLIDVVEKESGLCAMARVLHEVKNNPENSLIKKGELATFILVSDEKEHDPEGLECVKSYQFQQPVPGYLHKGECVDSEATVSYKIPSNKTVTLKVNKPYTRHIRQAYESIKDEVVERMGKCDVKFHQSQGRLKVNKNTHTVKFKRKVLDANGNDAISYWKHDLRFDRHNKKHDLKFDRTTLSHKLVFDRISTKYKLTGTRTVTSPRYSLDVKRQKIAKFQKVTYKREVLLTKEGGQISVVATINPAPLRVANVNFSSPTQCTVAWLRGVPAVAAAEESLEPRNSYRYTLSECVINNDVTTDNTVVTVVGTKPAVSSCNEALAKSIYPEGSLASHESYAYTSVSCSDLAAVVAPANLNITKDGGVPSVCDVGLASSLDAGKPSIDPSKGETLVYSAIACTNASTTEAARQITGIVGSYSAANIVDYIKNKDGDRNFTEYANYSYQNTPSSEANVKIENIVSSCPSSNLAAYVASKDNRANVSYSNESCVDKEIKDDNQSITNIDGKYDEGTMGPLVNYVKVKDGNKDNVRYDDLVVTNKPTYKIENLSVAEDGKAPATCDAAYARRVDNALPTLQSGETLVYSDVTCVNASTSFQLTRSGSTIKYDGTYAHRVLPYESGLGSTSVAGRACTEAEKSAMLANEASLSPSLFIIDNNKLEVDATNGCRVYNTDVTSQNSTAKTNILNAINGDNGVKYSANAAACDVAIANHCSSSSTLNSGGYYFCKHEVANYIKYIAPEPESRIYTLKAPVRHDGVNELHWFGFQNIQTVNKSNQPMEVNLLNLKCSQVVNACDAASANMTVLAYFKMKYAGNNDALYQAINKKIDSNDTVSDPLQIAACDANLISSHPRCNDKSVMVSGVLSYDTAQSDVAITVALDANVTCDDNCTADSCKTKEGSSFNIPILSAGQPKKIREFYGNFCTVGSYVTTGEATRVTAAVNLAMANSDSVGYANNADVCSVTCADSGLCKVAANSELDISTMTVRQYLAQKNQNIDPSKVTSCKVVRKAIEVIDSKRSYTEIDNACLRPLGVALANKYVRGKMQYYDADPAPKNAVKLVKENEASLENYIKRSFASVLGDGYVNMIAFTSLDSGTDGEPVGVDYNRVAESVRGQVRDVKASSVEYGEALKFLGEKVSAQLASSFKVSDIASSQQITRVWYSSWFTKGKFIELGPTDFSASANSFVITNPTIVEKMKNEASFKFFVEIY